MIMEGFETVSCELCGSNEFEALFNIRESSEQRLPPSWRGNSPIPLVKCNTCDLVFLNPRYAQDRLKALYQDPLVYQQSIDPEGRTRHIAAERVERVAQFRQEVKALSRFRHKGRLLDIGCGLGFFLEALGKDYDTFGLEWSHAAVDMARGQHPTVVEYQFPGHPFSKNEFDIVTFHNTLDHLPHPLEALRVTRQLLKADGLLMLTGSNFDSLAAKIYREGFRLLAPNHLYYFTATTLKRILTLSGFRLLRIEYPYFGTSFARPIRDAGILLKDWVAFNLLRKQETRISPPFYGNVMRVFALADSNR
jgi:SAM-dependent methyltransferase